jgi:polysaccharide biosynthesis transport protein
MNLFDFGALLCEFRRFWWLLILAVIVADGLVYVEQTKKTVTFASEAKMFLRANFEPGSNEGTLDFLGTQAIILEGRESISRTKKALAERGHAAQPVKLSVTAVPRTTVLLLKATGADPFYTRQFLDASMELYVAAQNQTGPNHANIESSLTPEIRRVQDEMNSASREIDDFQRQFSVPLIEDETKAETAYLATLRKRLTDLRLEKSVAVTRGPDPAVAGSLIPIEPTENNDPATNPQALPQEKLLAAQQDLATLEAEKDRLLINLRDQHPKVREISARISETEKLITSLSAQIQTSDDNRVAAIDREMEAMRAEIQQKEGHLFELTNRLTSFQTLKSRFEDRKNAYDKLMARMQDAGSEKQPEPPALTILELATPAVTGKNKLYSSLIRATGIGLFVGIGIVLIISRFNQRFETIASVTKRLGLPILGKILKDRWAANRRTVLDCDRNHLEFAESFRNLRSNVLNLLSHYPGKKCIAVTSALPHEGKSIVSANLAIALAAANARVLLVDGDLRRGKLNQLLRVETTHGLADILMNRKTLAQAIYRTRMPNLMLLPNGGPMRNIAEQMIRYGVEELMQMLGQHFDYVILDTPPVLAADDARTLAAKADWTLFVVRLGHSGATSSQRALEELTNRQIEIPGIVVNSVSRHETAHSYHHYYNNALEGNPFLELPDRGKSSNVEFRMSN